VSWDKNAPVYPYPVPFHCAAGCGEPIRQGMRYVQTSKDLRPLERMHVACHAGRLKLATEAAA
jgi:hypothetical protein